MLKDLREDMLEQQREREEKKGKQEEGCKSARILRIVGWVSLVLAIIYGIISFAAFADYDGPLYTISLIYPISAIVYAVVFWVSAMAFADMVENTQKIVDNTYVIANNTYIMANKGEKPQEQEVETEAEAAEEPSEPETPEEERPLYFP